MRKMGIRLAFQGDPLFLGDLLLAHDQKLSIPARLPHDLLPSRFRTETEILQNTPRHPVAFQDQAEQEMFGSDGSILRAPRFPGGKAERFFDARSVWDWIRDFAGWKSTHPILDLPPYTFT